MLNEHGEPVLKPLSEEQLLHILQKCKNYELNVTRYKVDPKYIKQLENCITDYRKLKNILPPSANSDQKPTLDPTWLAKVSRSIEKKIAELYDLIRKHKSQIIPMEVLGKLTQIQDFGQYQINETLKAKFLTLIVREYRKFKEVATVRQHKRLA